MILKSDLIKQNLTGLVGVKELILNTINTCVSFSLHFSYKYECIKADSNRLIPISTE